MFKILRVSWLVDSLAISEEIKLTVFWKISPFSSKALATQAILVPFPSVLGELKAFMMVVGIETCLRTCFQFGSQIKSTSNPNLT